MKAKNGGIIMEFKFEVPADKMDLFTSYIGDAKRILEGKEPKFTVSSPKEISEEEIEGLFLAKYGNKITASDSWVIRFALECVRKFSLPSSGSKTVLKYCKWKDEKYWHNGNGYILKSFSELNQIPLSEEQLFELFLKDKLTNKQGTIL